MEKVAILFLCLFNLTKMFNLFCVINIWQVRTTIIVSYFSWYFLQNNVIHYSSSTLSALLLESLVSRTQMSSTISEAYNNVFIVKWKLTYRTPRNTERNYASRLRCLNLNVKEIIAYWDPDFLFGNKLLWTL